MDLLLFIGLIIIWPTCSIIIFIERTIKIFNCLERAANDSIIITAVVPMKDVDFFELCVCMNGYFEYDESNGNFECQYKICPNNNPPAEQDILGDGAYCTSIKNTMPYALARDGGILEQLVKKYNAKIYFDCFIPPESMSAKNGLPFVFYEYDIDFLKKLNAHVCVWTYP